MNPVAYLVSGGRVYVDKAFVSKDTAEHSVRERDDGASMKPLVLSTAADAELARLREERDALRNGNTALLEALMGMAWQYMGHGDEDLVRHSFMSAGEECCDVLEAAGVATPTPDGCRLDWAALEARKRELDAALASRTQEGA